MEEAKNEVVEGIVVPENGGTTRLVSSLDEPLTVRIGMAFVLDKKIIRECKSREEVVMYVLDVLLKNHTNLLPLADQLRKEVLGAPSLIIPSGRLPR